MRRPEPWQRLLSHVRHSLATPFVLRIGTGPPGLAPPVGVATRKPSSLPIIAANYCELSPFEKDYAVRCLEYLAHEACDSEANEKGVILHTASAHSIVPTLLEHDCAATWRPMFDLVVLPDGSLWIGWLRHHALDLGWGDHAESYIADLWQRAPRMLWAHSRDNVNRLVRRLLPMRHRHLSVFNRQDKVTRAETEQCLQVALRSLHAATSTVHQLEDGVLHTSKWGKPTLLCVRELMHETAQRDRELPTGTAIALMRLLILTYATYYESLPQDVAEAMKTSAGRICELASDSGCHQLLTWGALLLGCADDHGTFCPDVVQGDAAIQALTLTLLTSIGVPGDAREAAFQWQAKHHLHPLCDTLVSEEGLLHDALAAFGTDIKSAEEVALLSSLGAAGALSPDRDATENTTACGDVAASHFSRVLGEAITEVENNADTKWEPVKQVGQPPLAWLPGTGADAKGCWCTLLTHSRILLSHSRAGESHTCNKAMSLYGGTVERVHSMLRIALVRRCLFATTDANISSQYSMITHLLSCEEAPWGRLTLIHLVTAGVPSEVVHPNTHERALMGLFFLFPSLSLRAFYGGTVEHARASLSVGGGVLECRPCCTDSQTSAAPDTCLQVRIPAIAAEELAARLLHRDAALICVVDRVSAKSTAAFLLEDLCVSLHKLLRRA
ncbi:hypothetical protein LSCM1_04293 [Leishmania martiniquensis]|uniref:Uncharacterized protein n=1 Tax=Leishmania martiniquensis TaxID=1580590 RepID=A0A836H9S1_9TRYP|nr:hypothetical protein LSCM1_04293 [Leishmania martiniquensis]